MTPQYQVVNRGKRGFWLTEIRENDGYSYGDSAHGRSTAVVTCAFCHLGVEVYIWSFNGCGKKCPHCPDTMLSVYGSQRFIRKVDLCNRCRSVSTGMIECQGTDDPTKDCARWA